MDKTPWWIDKRYEIYQTIYSKHQGVWIIAKKNLVTRCFINENNCIIAVQWQEKEHTYFILGAYFKHNIKDKILSTISKLIKRIRQIFNNLKLILFGDMNTDKNFTIEKIENEFKLNISRTNKTLITRGQWRKELEDRSTLDFFMSSYKIDQLEKLTKFKSDHYPILAWIQTTAVSKSRKLIKIIQKKLISKDIKKNTLESPGWPTITNSKNNKLLLYNNISIRPTIKLQYKANIY